MLYLASFYDNCRPIVSEVASAAICERVREGLFGVIGRANSNRLESALEWHGLVTGYALDFAAEVIF